MTTFLEAQRILAAFDGGPEFPFLVGMSGTADPFTLYLQAACARLGTTARPRYLPFNTLHQHLAGESDGPAIYLLLPWDLVPETDWRSGVPHDRITPAEALRRAAPIVQALQRRSNSPTLYLPAPLPPVVGYPTGERALQHGLDALIADLGSIVLPQEAFALGTYFASGCPVGGAWLGRVADRAVQALTTRTPSPAKVLVTDLDHTLWAGVIAEDGSEGIRFSPEGEGYRHYVYQTFLKRLRSEGVVVAAVSRNDRAVVLPPLVSGAMPLGESDFVAICASYHAKSAQIQQLAQQLNLGLDSFVFVDDNPVECEEVRQALPQVRVAPFPTRDEGLPALLHDLAHWFGHREVTAEDAERTQLYRRRLEGMAPAELGGADLTRFLAELQMRLHIHDRTGSDRTRAIQLINKTNQFNANGRRWTADEVSAILAGGGRLFTGTLGDRSGSHGETIAMLLTSSGIVEAFVMSCRVFQRRMEHAFVVSLVDQGVIPTAIRLAATERNEPFRQFAQGPGFPPSSTDPAPFDAAAFAASHRATLDLFEVSWD